MSRDWRLYLDDMLLCCENVTEYVGTMTREQFLGTKLVTHAVLHNLEVLGEAAKHLPEDVKGRMPGVAWREIAGMRDWLAHAYFRINPDVVWNVIKVEVPILSRTLQAFKDENQP
jgi:uncharacterized protein with HEPN domain